MAAPGSDSVGASGSSGPRVRAREWVPRTDAGSSEALAELLADCDMRVKSVDGSGWVHFELSRKSLDPGRGSGSEETKKENR